MVEYSLLHMKHMVIIPLTFPVIQNNPVTHIVAVYDVVLVDGCGHSSHLVDLPNKAPQVWVLMHHLLIALIKKHRTNKLIIRDLSQVK